MTHSMCFVSLNKDTPEIQIEENNIFRFTFINLIWRQKRSSVAIHIHSELGQKECRE